MTSALSRLLKANRERRAQAERTRAETARQEAMAASLEIPPVESAAVSLQDRETNEGSWHPALHVVDSIEVDDAEDQKAVGDEEDSENENEDTLVAFQGTAPSPTRYTNTGALENPFNAKSPPKRTRDACDFAEEPHTEPNKRQKVAKSAIRSRAQRRANGDWPHLRSSMTFAKLSRRGQSQTLSTWMSDMEDHLEHTQADAVPAAKVLDFFDRVDDHLNAESERMYNMTMAMSLILMLEMKEREASKETQRQFDELLRGVVLQTRE
ncbi:hypothetical protein LTR99_005709 [Exophiala xenobiotica]|uniref:Uncharacterized protein n=1 Tax=Vermiconidia calcicola TaxID=1690605 RepID=A0AAV9QE50_9PEZI|nr:hypothetical protein LTR41_003088 [Exophiala xenobiotica]KAK5540335.1 hypothetical protein LTR23_006432 [Chaetothyriales sp. CCFEE 6169]KAK5541217.1 hypothetical protein LTR25_002994 [Vermiconidia calcicola]KAK5270325.1 hypothetical protein LTR96_004826 [Exophiala xenobiotica]KAK5302752.1 hypothetical protein LTR99_005709 [Exophiala xenobiotica]